jgi:glycosyltransferase involved in cell wall biosynthesis
MHVVIYEPSPGGHRYTHIKRLLPAVAKLAQRITFVTTREGVASPEYEAQIKGVEHLCEVETSIVLDGSAFGSFRDRAEDLRRVATQLAPDHLLVPYADRTIQMVGLRSLMRLFSLPEGLELEGLMMRGSFAYKRPTLREVVRARAWLTLTAAAPFQLIHHMDPIVIRAVEDRAPDLWRRMRLVPDPVERYEPPSTGEARRRLGLREDGRYIGCVGSIDRRKGIDRLIRAFLAARLDRGDRLLLTGRQEPAIRQVLIQEASDAIRQGRIVTLDRYITDEEFRLSIAAMDVVCTPYPPDGGHSGSSSIAIHAAGQQRPLLGTSFGWIGDTIQRFELGRAADVMDVLAFARGVSASLDASNEYRITEAGRRFVEFHRPENFVACVTRRLRERLSQPADAGLRTWDWVLAAAESRYSMRAPR